jgi:16S rRNA C967 or C1407 C5-methylase (RsmB/RsmF family)
MILPELFIQRIGLEFPVEAALIIEAYHNESFVTIRTNPAKAGNLNLPDIPWCSTGYILEKRPLFTSDPLLHAGAYYVQESSSMILERIIAAIIEVAQPIRVLDLCAAPGGKSTHLLSLLPLASFVANETDGRRNAILQENLIKWGTGYPAITSAPALFFGEQFPDTFDLILVDAPCSGEGLFRKHPDYVHAWHAGMAETCSIRQKDILRDIWPAVQPGGFLIYSTCTLNNTENTEVIRSFLADYSDAEQFQIVLPDVFNFHSDGHGGYYALPGCVPGDGFYFSVLRKKGHFQEDVRKTSVCEFEWRQSVYHIDSNLKDLINSAHQLGYLRLPGIEISSPESKLPSHAAALHVDTECIRNKFPVVSLNHTQALEYLKRQALSCSHFRA